MDSNALLSLITELQEQKSERQNVELKSCALGFPKKIYDALSSFSNQDNGGIIIFGIQEKPDFEIVGVYDADDVQKKIMENCNQMEPKVRPLINICTINEKIIVAAEIPGVEINKRPVFYAGVGRIKGSYIRVGDADEPMSEYEIYSYEAFRKRIREDQRLVDRVQIELFDQQLLEKYLQAVKHERKNLSKNLSDEQILELMGVTFSNKPTLAGVLVFSRYPQTFFSQLCITCVSVPGTEIGSIGDEGERFIDNKRYTGPITDMLEGAVEFIRRNSRTKTVIDENGHRKDKPEYPMLAVREAVLNALVHRDYSMYTENIPISIEMYRDRLEIKNSGGLYGNTPVQALGSVRPETRNAILANILELLKITENRYSGIPTIQNELRKAGLPPAEFSVRRGEFTVVFRNNIFPQELAVDKNSLEHLILTFCKEPKSRQEIVALVGKSRYYVMKELVQPLIQKGLLAMTMPEKPQSSKQKFYSV
ncbi:MAG: ATP-binding protein [Phascolarctobacterium sp.]|nr:ATP-binding protein [Phascolarctobacterium sp.]